MSFRLFVQVFGASPMDFAVLCARGFTGRRRQMANRPAGRERAGVTLRLAQVPCDHLNVTPRRERFDGACPAETVDASILRRIELRHQASTNEASRAGYE